MNKVIKVSVVILVNLITGCVHPSNDRDASFSAPIWEDRYSDSLVMPKRIAAVGKRVFIFNPRAEQWAAYDIQGQLVGYGRANGGGVYCSDLDKPCLTPTGIFNVFRMGNADCYSKTFPIAKGGGASMPYCMFFSGGSAIHGSVGLSMINNSHGCVHVTIRSAEWLANNFIQLGTEILVLSY